MLISPKHKANFDLMMVTDEKSGDHHNNDKFHGNLFNCCGDMVLEERSGNHQSL